MGPEANTRSGRSSTRRRTSPKSRRLAQMGDRLWVSCSTASVRRSGSWAIPRSGRGG